MEEELYVAFVHALQVDLYINYDCDMNAANVYERSVKGLAVVAAGKDTVGRTFA